MRAKQQRIMMNWEFLNKILISFTYEEAEDQFASLLGGVGGLFLASNMRGPVRTESIMLYMRQ